MFLQICKNMKIQIFTFSFITFDPFEVRECAIPKNNGLNQTNLPYFIAFLSKMTTNGLKLRIYESQIFGISLYKLLVLLGYSAYAVAQVVAQAVAYSVAYAVAYAVAQVVPLAVAQVFAQGFSMLSID